MPEIQTSFSQELYNDITTWVNAPIPSDSFDLHTHVNQAICLFCQVTTRYDAVVPGHAATVAQHNQALTQACDTNAFLNKELI